MRDPELLPFGCATVDPAYLPIQALNRILTQVTREMTTVGARYEGAPGLLTLRRQIARRSSRPGVALAEHDLCTTIGATEALSLALRAVAKPGDVIAVESPAYFGVLQTIEGLGLRALEIPAHPRTGLDVDGVRGERCAASRSGARRHADDLEPARLDHARRGARAARPHHASAHDIP